MLTDNKKKMRWTMEDFKNSEDIVDRTVWFIATLSPHNLWKGSEALLALCESIRAEALKEVEGIIGKDDIKVENKDDDEETWCDTCGNYYGGEYSTECECDTRNALRKEQRAVLAKLSQEEE